MTTEEDFEVETMHFKRLLLAVDDDDDESSQRAFNYACTLAKVYGIPLGIVSVLETGDMNIYQTLEPNIVADRRSDISKHLNTYVDKAKEFGVLDAEPIIGEGRPARVILDEVVPNFKPDLIIVGSHEHSHHRLGSVASEVARYAKPSVIIVR